MSDERLFFPGGIDGLTGDPIVPPGLEDVARFLKERFSFEPSKTREVIDGVQAQDLSQAGWGIICAEADPKAAGAIKALKPLLKRRQKQAGGLFRRFVGPDGYRAGESRLTFLSRHKSRPGRVDPKLMPYYVLLVGSPEQIPYLFQYELDMQHAVGRLYFETPDGYAAYAKGVVEAEETAFHPRQVAFFEPCQDEVTRNCNSALLAPLVKSVRERSDCDVHAYLGETATKATLEQLMGGEETPDLLVTVGHGLYYRSGHERQLTHQGALVCQGWPGKGYAPEPEHVFAGKDLNGGARLQGLLALLFACNSAGTPERNDFASKPEEHWDVALKPFISCLAERLLGHPSGGALAVVGHVEQLWQHSFLWREAGAQPQPFIEVVHRLLNGGPVGWAMEPLNQRYADLAVALGELLKDGHLGLDIDDATLAELWISTQDARNYVIVGDPAVRLPAAAPPPEKKPTKRG